MESQEGVPQGMHLAAQFLCAVKCGNVHPDSKLFTSGEESWPHAELKAPPLLRRGSMGGGERWKGNQKYAGRLPGSWVGSPTRGGGCPRVSARPWSVQQRFAQENDDPTLPPGGGRVGLVKPAGWKRPDPLWQNLLMAQPWIFFWKPFCSDPAGSLRASVQSGYSACSEFFFPPSLHRPFPLRQELASAEKRRSVVEMPRAHAATFTASHTKYSPQTQ